jgi:hypothetical protein
MSEHVSRCGMYALRRIRRSARSAVKSRLRTDGLGAEELPLTPGFTTSSAALVSEHFSFAAETAVGHCGTLAP